MEFLPGLVLAERYVLVRRLGTGGMSEVWLARNTATGADVAAKVLLASRAASKDALERFRREAHATAALTHRNIVRVFDLVELDRDQGSLLMIMEHLRGQTLGNRLEDEPRLPIDTALAIVLPILSALDHAHGSGIVHRDLKPDNVYLSLEPDGQMLPKLLDFGISKVRGPRDAITIDGELVGTPCYMSPEQAKGKSTVDARSDVFSVGTLLYEMIAGYNPFVREDLHTVIMAIIDYEPPRIERLPDALWNVVSRTLAKDPNDRYSSAGELSAALRSAVGETLNAPTLSYAPPLTASIPPSSKSIDKKPSRRMPMVYAAAAVVLVLAGIGFRASRRGHWAGVTQVTSASQPAPSIASAASVMNVAATTSASTQPAAGASATVVAASAVAPEAITPSPVAPGAPTHGPEKHSPRGPRNVRSSVIAAQAPLPSVPVATAATPVAAPPAAPIPAPRASSPSWRDPGF